MAITNNEFTQEELVAAVTAKPELLSGVIIPHLASNKYVVRDEATEKSYLETYGNQKVGEYTSKVATEVETFLETTTGIKKKDANEKWYDYNQRVAKELFQRSTTLQTERDTAQQELTKLRGTANLTDAEKQRIADLEKTLETTKTDFETYKTTTETNQMKAKAENAILSDVAPVRNTFFKDKKFEKAIEVMHNTTMKELLDGAQVDPHTGKVIFFGADKKALIKDGQYITAKDLYAEKMKDFIDAGKKQPGAGGNGDDIESDIEGVPAGIRNQVQLTEYLQKKGMTAGSTEFQTEFNKYASKLPRR